MSYIMNGKTKVFIDGFEVKILSVNLDIDSYSAATITHRVQNQQNNIKATIVLDDGSSFEFRPMGYETHKVNGFEEIHFYGPIRSLLPHLFTEHNLYAWQEAYLKRLTGFTKIMLFSLYNHSATFQTREAEAFRIAYETGRKFCEPEYVANRKVK